MLDSPVLHFHGKKKSSLLFPRQLITFSNSLDPVQYQQNVGSDLDTDQVTL